MPITRTPLGNSGAASSIQSLLARLPWMKRTVTSPSPHSRQPSWTSPARTRATIRLLLVQAGSRRCAGRRWRNTDSGLAGRAIDQTVDGGRRIDDHVAELDEVDDIGRELHRVVRMDEVPRIGVDLHHWTIARGCHALDERNDDAARKVLQPVEARPGNERLLGAEGQEDRRLDLRQ